MPAGLSGHVVACNKIAGIHMVVIPSVWEQEIRILTVRRLFNLGCLRRKIFMKTLFCRQLYYSCKTGIV